MTNSRKASGIPELVSAVGLTVGTLFNVTGTLPCYDWATPQQDQEVIAPSENLRDGDQCLMHSVDAGTAWYVLPNIPEQRNRETNSRKVIICIHVM